MSPLTRAFVFHSSYNLGFVSISRGHHVVANAQTKNVPLHHQDLERRQMAAGLVEAVGNGIAIFFLLGFTPQETNISPPKWHFEDDFPFPPGGIC